MSKDAAPLSETIRFNVDTGTVQLTSFKQLDELLASIQAKAEAAGRALGRATSRSPREFLGVLRGRGQKTFDSKDLAKIYAEQFGLSGKALETATKDYEQKFNQQMTTLGQRLRNKVKGGQFSAVGAAGFLGRFEANNPSSLGQVIGRTAGRGAAAPVVAAVDPTALSASLKDSFAQLAASLKAAGGGGGGVGSGPGGGKGGGAKTLGPIDPDSLAAGLTGETITRTAAGTRTAYKQLLAADKSVTSTLNEKNELIREVTRINKDASKELVQNLRNARRLAKGSGGGRAGKARAEADAIDGFLRSKDFASLPEVIRERLGGVAGSGARGDLGSTADLLRSRAGEVDAAASARASEKARGAGIAAKARAERIHEQQADTLEADRVRQEKLTGTLREARAKAEAKYEKDRLRAFKALNKFENVQPPPLPGRRAGFLEQAFSKSASRYGFGDGGGGGPTRPLTPLGGLAGGAANFLGDVVHVGRWAGAVTVAAGAVGLLATGMKALVDVGYQTARLDQVFSGVGGTTRQLVVDVLGLSAALGREKEEALDSAIAWSRLGLTRTQVNEAVRVSLQAANVAEISAGQATESLQAVLAAYKFEVSDLAGVLATLNATSNTFNVTNADLLDGLSRASAVTRQAGLGFAELTGLIAAGVGSTGQTGANIGNAIKSLTVALGNPETQNFLRDRFKIETASDSKGGLKAEGDLLAELKTRYDELTDAERNELIVRVAGKTQASRVVALLNSYTTAMALASNAVRDFNSAEEENAKITATLGNSLKGIGGLALQGLDAAFGPAVANLGKDLNAVRNALGQLDELSGKLDKSSAGRALKTFAGVVGKGLEGLSGGGRLGLVRQGFRALFPDAESAGGGEERTEERLRASASGYRIAAREARRNVGLLGRGQDIDRGRLSRFELLPDLSNDPAVARQQLEEAADENEATADRLAAEATTKMAARARGLVARQAELRQQLRAAPAGSDARASLSKEFENTVTALDKLQEKMRNLRPDFDSEGVFAPLAKIEELQRGLLTARGNSFNTGDTPTEGLLNQRRKLLEDQVRLQKESARTGGETIQIQVNRNLLEQNLVSTYERQLQINKELVELKRNARREEARALVTAGPEEILKRLAAQRFSGTNNLNQFLSLGGETRGLIAQNPDSPFNFEANSLRREAGKLGGGLPGLEEFFQRLVGDSPESLLRLASGAEYTARMVQSLGDAVGTLTAGLNGPREARSGEHVVDLIPTGVAR